MSANALKREKLPDYIAAHLSTPFEWGSFDCILFVSKWVEQAAGVDYLAEVPSWNSALQGMRMVDEMGGMEAILDARFERIHPNLAQDGDVAVYQAAAHIFSGTQIVGTGEHGLVFTSRMEADGAWSLSSPTTLCAQRAFSKG